jgi:hypothetical protein
MWEVVLWYGNKPTRKEFATKEEAYTWSNNHNDATAIEVYGPNGEYDGS